MAAIDEVGKSYPQMPLNASMSRLRAGEIDMVAGTDYATINKSDFSFPEHNVRRLQYIMIEQKSGNSWPCVRPEKIY